MAYDIAAKAACAAVRGYRAYCERPEPEAIAFRWGPGGALVTNDAIPGITQELDGECAVYYGGRYLVAETLSPGAAAALVAALGGVLQEQPQHEGGSNV